MKLSTPKRALKTTQGKDLDKGEADADADKDNDKGFVGRETSAAFQMVDTVLRMTAKPYDNVENDIE